MLILFHWIVCSCSKFKRESNFVYLFIHHPVRSCVRQGSNLIHLYASIYHNYVNMNKFAIVTIHYVPLKKIKKIKNVDSCVNQLVRKSKIIVS